MFFVVVVVVVVVVDLKNVVLLLQFTLEFRRNSEINVCVEEGANVYVPHGHIRT
jgi:hypothetical protein